MPLCFDVLLVSQAHLHAFCLHFAVLINLEVIYLYCQIIASVLSSVACDGRVQIPLFPALQPPHSSPPAPSGIHHPAKLPVFLHNKIHLADTNNLTILVADTNTSDGHANYVWMLQEWG